MRLRVLLQDARERVVASVLRIDIKESAAPLAAASATLAVDATAVIMWRRRSGKHDRLPQPRLGCRCATCVTCICRCNEALQVVSDPPDHWYRSVRWPNLVKTVDLLEYSAHPTAMNAIVADHARDPDRRYHRGHSGASDRALPT